MIKKDTSSSNSTLDYWIDTKFQGVNRHFVSAFSANDNSIGNSIYYFPSKRVEGYNVMIDRKNFFDQSIKYETETCDNIRRTTIGQGDDYKTGCLFDYNYFKETL